MLFTLTQVDTPGLQPGRALRFTILTERSYETVVVVFPLVPATGQEEPVRLSNADARATTLAILQALMPLWGCLPTACRLPAGMMYGMAEVQQLSWGVVEALKPLLDVGWPLSE